MRRLATIDYRLDNVGCQEREASQSHLVTLAEIVDERFGGTFNQRSACGKALGEQAQQGGIGWATFMTLIGRDG